jgi:hypothetical protein
MPIPGLDAAGITPELKPNLNSIVLNLVFFIVVFFSDFFLFVYYCGFFILFYFIFIFIFFTINFTIAIFSPLFSAPSLSLHLLCYNPFFYPTLSAPSHPLSSHPFPFPYSPPTCHHTISPSYILTTC